MTGGRATSKRSPRAAARRAKLKALRQWWRLPRRAFWRNRRRLRESPTIRVLVIDGWSDAADGLRDMTPGGSGRIGRVHYALQHDQEPHYQMVMLRLPRGAALPQLYPSRRLWFVIGEPPLPELAHDHETPARGAVVYSVDPRLQQPPFSRRNDYRQTFCLQRTWRVHKTMDELAAMPLPSDKPRSLSWITSALRRFGGHRVRMEFLDRLRASGLEFDLFGYGFQPIDDKWDGLAPYRYSIAFENSSYPEYWSEKVCDPIVAGALPFYYGCPALERYLPAKSFIRIDPEDPLVIDRIREVVASDLWLERRPALEEAKAAILQKYNTFAFLAGEIERDFPRVFGR